MQILFEDHHFIAVNKPGALLTQAPPGIPSLEAMVKDYIRTAYAKPAGVYLGIPHRLDRPVSGVVLFARNSKAAARVAKQFHDHTVQKTYWALVEAGPADKTGEWVDLLRKKQDEPCVEVVEAGTEGSREAITGYRVLKRENGLALMELLPRTGRMHQLRVQAAVRGWPIVGDAFYGSQRSFGPDAELPRDRLIALHAKQLALEHPFRHEPLAIDADTPAVWGAVSRDA